MLLILREPQDGEVVPHHGELVLWHGDVVLVDAAPSPGGEGWGEGAA